mmetsp:Transcript_13351/g.20858  ORF Transcript_13351/g.20858 Transcript_13351/m.20858 type:complete len:150 (-) Transcript_13351:1640-2089(-)
MAGDFMNFVVIYTILLSMFCIVGNLNFLFDLSAFETLFDSLITILDASMGNYDFSIFDGIEGNANLLNFGKSYLMVGVIIFTILILNLIIAILSNTYNQQEGQSNGLYLAKILSTRDEVSYDENYSAFLSAMSPLNCIILPLVPLGIFM